MWDKPPIPSSSGATSQPVSTTVSAQGSSSGPGASKKPVYVIVSPMVSRAGNDSEPAMTPTMIERRKIRNRELAEVSGQRKQINLQKALEQFHKDNILCSSVFSTPLVELPGRPKSEDYLNVEYIKKTMDNPCFTSRMGNINRDAMARLVCHPFPAMSASNRKKQFALQVRDYLGLRQPTPETLCFLEVLRRDIRNAACANAGREYRRRVLNICAQTRAQVEQLKQQVRTCITSLLSEVLQPGIEMHGEPGREPGPSSSVAPTLRQPENVTRPESEPVANKSVAELLQADSARLYPLLKKQRGYYLVDGLPYSQFSVPQEVRDRLISDELKDRISMKENWGTGRYFALVPVSDSSSFCELMKQARFDPAASSEFPLGIALADPAEDERVLTWQKIEASGKKAPVIGVTLHKACNWNEQNTLALYNSHNTRPVRISLGKQKEYLLKPGSGVFFQPRVGKSKKSLEWTAVTEYRTGRPRQEDTNPLIRDLPRPIESADSEPAPWSREGEYFLSPEVVSDLAQQKSRTGTKPAICYTSANIQQTLKDTFGRSGEKTGAANLIFCDRHVNHTVAVRVLRKDGKALVYIHETLDPASPVATAIREGVLHAVRPFFKQSELSFVTPGFTSQVDFSSCGVFTYKAIRAFDKQPGLDEWLWLQGQQPGRVLHQAGQYDRKLKLNNLALEQCFVPLNEMKAKLLKCYQGDEVNLSPAQLAEVVSVKKQETLGEYLMAHQPFQALLNSAKANLSTTGKRYKYLMKWQEQFLQKTMEPDPEMAQSMLAAGDALTPEEYQLVTCFHPIIDVKDRNDTNQWLAEHMPGTAEVEESDWGMSCLFEDFAFGTKNISLADAKGLNEWLDNALSHPDDKHHQLMQAWCIYIKQSRKSQFRNTSLQDIHDALRRYIALQTQPAAEVAEVAGIKRGSTSSAKSKGKRPKKPQQAVQQTPPLSLESEIPAVVGKKHKRDDDTDIPAPVKLSSCGRKRLKLTKSQRQAKRRDEEVERRKTHWDGLKRLANNLESKPVTEIDILETAVYEIRKLQLQEKLKTIELGFLKQKQQALEQKLKRLIGEYSVSKKTTDPD